MFVRGSDVQSNCKYDYGMGRLEELLCKNKEILKLTSYIKN